MKFYGMETCVKKVFPKGQDHGSKKKGISGVIFLFQGLTTYPFVIP
ncbi:hypothetical protein O163_13710 [Caldanaerobacter subterraneus subsp. yonseiensis KB-1]|jgi:hypothetical protein|uniref:Uncharacterized protein n=1 Tax=Caldanaerobacter subterraneus subsp. yonseiensis KB-1 TaxID=1388761 RepID=U5CPJ0_CALSX|nr:hypothetical protein O163_13710 [Caldanaerobacter subterraneus subsp. yonseiensis KB-1]